MPRQPTARQPARPPEPHARDGFVAVGRVRGAHGVRGELKIDLLTDAPDRFTPGAIVHAAGAPRTVRSARLHREVLLLELSGVDTRARAAELRGALLEVPEEELPLLQEGRYYRHQIVGLQVFDQQGQSLGRVVQILETGANDVYVTRSDEGDLLIPAIDTVVKDVDLTAGRIVVELLPGLERTAHKPPRGKRPAE